MWTVPSTIGKSFFIAGLLPAIALLGLIDLVIIPLIPGAKPLIEVTFFDINGVVYILGGLFLGFLLLALNGPILQLFGNGLVISRWLKRRNADRVQRRYTALAARREDYRQSLEAAPGSPDLEAAIAKLDAVHQSIESKLRPDPLLPHDPEVVAPTDLGNVFAAAQEYPYERYGMDVLVYWRRLAGVISGEHKTWLDDLKTTLDFLLNLSLAAGLFGLAALIAAAWLGRLPELAYGLLALAAAYLLYRVSIGIAREFCEVIRICFDLFRGKLAEAYQLTLPGDLAAERQFWLALARFIRRGEDFYFPYGSPDLQERFQDQHTLRQQALVLMRMRQRAEAFEPGQTPTELRERIRALDQQLDETRSKLSAYGARPRKHPD